MKNESNQIVYLFVLCYAFALLFVVSFLPIKPVKTSFILNERVRVDSVSVKNITENLPDKTWTYYTKIGPFFTNTECFEIGDSIDLKVVRISKK